MGSADYIWVATPMGLGLMYLLWLLRGWRTEQQKKVDAYYEKNIKKDWMELLWE